MRGDSFLAPTHAAAIVGHMKSRRKHFPSDTINAAGGILVMAHRPPLVAIVQRRKDDGWVLPKGKLKARETAFAAARREVTEETGHRVTVHDYLGAVSYQAGSRPKVVQFWRMATAGKTARKPMGDIKAVKWLSLQDAIARLSHPLERAFLTQIGAHGLKPMVARQIPSPSSKLRKTARPKLRLDPVAASPPVSANGKDKSSSASLISRLFRRLQDKHGANAPLS